MKHYRLKHEEARGLGFTDLFKILYTDFTSSTAAAGVSADLVLTSLAVGDVLGTGTLLEVRTNAAGLTQADGSAGPSTGGTILGASNLLAAGGEYYVPAASVAALPITAAANLVFTITPNSGLGVEQAVNLISAGEFWLWVSIKRKADRAIQV